MKKNEEEKKTVFGTKEWASSNHNIQYGCENNCKYCYARAMTPRHKKTTVDGWKEPILKESAVKANFGKRDGTIMFPTTHDITEWNIDHCSNILTKMLDKGNKILVVSKPSHVCIVRLCGELKKFKEQILFRFTIGSADNEVLKFWEPGAPSFKERLDSLSWAYTQGFETSVSCEPMLDNDIEAVVKEVSPFVTDAIWIGKANFLVERLKMNKEWDTATEKKALELIKWQRRDNIVALYEKLKDNPKIKWKESIKKVVGLEIPTEAGLDI